jgi:hypothetical protein
MRNMRIRFIFRLPAGMRRSRPAHSSDNEGSEDSGGSVDSLAEFIVSDHEEIERETLTETTMRELQEAWGEDCGPTVVLPRRLRTRRPPAPPKKKPKKEGSLFKHLPKQTKNDLRELSEEELRQGATQCPLCLTRGLSAVTSCGHFLCVPCAHKLTSDSCFECRAPVKQIIRVFIPGGGHSKPPGTA